MSWPEVVRLRRRVPCAAFAIACHLALAGCGKEGAESAQADGDGGLGADSQVEVDASSPAIVPRLDPSFGTAGTFSGELSAWTPVGVAIDALGRVLVSGPSAVGGSPPAEILVRIDSDNALDDTFGNSGRVVIPVVASVTPQVIQLLPDGRIGLLGGVSIDGSQGAFAVLLATDGGVEPTFGSGAPQTAPIGFLSGGIWLPDGSVFALGTSATMRFSASGATDTSYGDGGLLPPAAAGALSSTGTLWAAEGAVLSRYQADGTPDVTFGVNAMVELTAPPGSEAFAIQSLVLESDGSAIVVGSHLASGFAYVDMAHVQESGTIDGTYGQGGFVSMQVQGGLVGAAQTVTGETLAWTTYGEVVEADSSGTTFEVWPLSIPGGALIAAAPDSSDRLVVVGAMSGDPADSTYFVSRYLLPSR